LNKFDFKGFYRIFWAYPRYHGVGLSRATLRFGATHFPFLSLTQA